MRKRDRQEGRQTVQATDIVAAGPPPPAQSAPPAGAGVVLDPEKYRARIAELELSAEQEREYIETVWAILLQAMLLGIRLEFEPESCGQLPETPPPPPISGGNAVDLKDRNIQSNFSDAAGQTDAVAEEGAGHGH